MTSATSTNGNYAWALVRSWWWHLTYGMWKGYRETRTYSPWYSKDGSAGQGKELVALTSTDGEFRIVKVFWEKN